MEQTQNQKPMCTIVLIIINIFIFLVFSVFSYSVDTTFMIRHGAMYGPLVTEGGEYYRFISSMFIHFDINHLLNNMLMLGVLGSNLEPEIGKLKFLLIYFVSGVGGGLLSFWIIIITIQNVVSGGASGAIFGLMGALLGILIKKKSYVGRLTKRGMLVMVGFSLYVGLTSTGVDNAAHIGGLICGLIVAMLL